MITVTCKIDGEFDRQMLGRLAADCGLDEVDWEVLGNDELITEIVKSQISDGLKVYGIPMELVETTVEIRNTMTVKSLIKKLQSMNQDSEVYLGNRADRVDSVESKFVDPDEPDFYKSKSEITESDREVIVIFPTPEKPGKCCK